MIRLNGCYLSDLNDFITPPAFFSLQSSSLHSMPSFVFICRRRTSIIAIANLQLQQQQQQQQLLNTVQSRSQFGGV